MGGEVTMPAFEHRAEHVSLLRWQLEPESARTATVTKQSAVPVTAFLTCAALFFTACVGVLVVGARPAAPGVVLPVVSLAASRDASALRDRALMDSLAFDERWYDQGSTLDAVKIDHQREGASETDRDDFAPQLGFEKWRGAPYWQHFREIPVRFNRPSREMAREKLVVVGHATDRSDIPLWLGSLRRHDLPGVTSGEGARRHGDEDQNMGLKAALLKLRELAMSHDPDANASSPKDEPESFDPIVVFTDAAATMFACDADEMARRFDRMDADVVVGTDLSSGTPRRGTTRGGISWGDGGSIVGRRSKMVELIERLESFPAENERMKRKRGEGEKRFDFDLYAACANETSAHDDRTCLKRYISEEMSREGSRVTLDSDGVLLHAMRGTEMRDYVANAFGEPTYEKGGEVSAFERPRDAPCVFHFNDEKTKEFMKPMANAFPGVFV
jgi:hypothetical protein